MSDTKGTPESNLGPFETYRTSLGEMKEEAARARETADALEAEVREGVNALETEARKAAEALNTLEERIPQWWQLGELTTRNVSYEPIQTWQEKFQELLESAQSDFSSGTVSRVQKGTEKIHSSISELKKIRKKLKNEIKKKKEKIDKKTRKQNKINKNLERSKKSISSRKISLRNKATGFSIAAFIVGSLGGCALGAVGPSQPSGMDGLIFGSPSAVLVWVLTYFVGKSNIDKERLVDLKKNKNKTEESIASTEEEIDELKRVMSKTDVIT
jgi:chromosome segregation ATPase